jgi:phosphonate transport system ATP-binding protein
LTPVVRLHAVQVRADQRVLLEVPRLEIAAGERLAIVGPNGAGKSTLLGLIGAQVSARQGTVQVLGHSIGPDAVAGPHGGHRAGAAERRALRQDSGLLMQGLHLVPRLSARENVLIGALGRLRGAQAWLSCGRWYARELRDEADAALASLGLAGRADTRADRLSGGERQKVALARLQLQRPRLLLADEPTSALDPAATRDVCLALRSLAAAPGRTLLTVVHDPELLPLLATRVLGMAEGRLVWDRPLAAVTPPLLQSLYARRELVAGNLPAEQAPRTAVWSRA